MSPAPRRGDQRADDRRRQPQNRWVHGALIAVSTALAVGVGVWLMVIGRG